MTTNYPTTLDTTTELKNNAVDGTVTLNTHAGHHNNVSDALIAIETEIGVSIKGSFADLADRLSSYVYKTNAAAQVIRPTGDFIALALRQHATQSAASVLVAQDENANPVANWDRTGLLNANGYKVAGSALASTHLSDTAELARNPSPSIVTPTISSPNMTVTPVSTTPAVDNNSTRIATTAFVKGQGYVTIDAPVFTGNPIAPTQAVDNDSTRIATTAYVVAQIQDMQTSPAPAGSILGFAGSSAPSGWLLCDGSAVSTTTYAALYAIIGVSYGNPGGGNFNLPDMRGRMAVGKGTHVDVNALTDNDAEGTVANRRPHHAHTFSITSDTQEHGHSGSLSSVGSHSHSGSGGASQGGIATGGGASPGSSSGQTTSTDGDHSHSVSFGGDGHSHGMTGTVGTAGMTDTPGYLTTNYIIKT